MTAATGFPIVGIGASAGGVEALEGFFRGLPDRPGLGFVIVTHLSPERESRLHEVVAHLTGLTVRVATDGMAVERDTVHVMPADAVLGIEGGRLRLQRPDGARRERKPIDIFFGALAADQGEAAAGIVLSGGDGDGTLGLKAIKERGGLTLAQVGDGYGPANPDMPESAISAGFVDLALPAGEMGTRLVDFARGLTLLDGMADAQDNQSAEAQDLEPARQEIYGLLLNQVGHDFAGYKSRTFHRRVRRRMQLLGLETSAAYVERLRQDPPEVVALFRDLLISVTDFFRDADAFEALGRLVIPKLLGGRGAEDAVRIWVPGCATGEEAFSIAILLLEHMEGRAAVPRVQIFATDIDEHALGVARAARYPAALLDSVSPERRQRFFVEDGGSYRVAKEVRDLCVFSPHSVLRDPPFSRIDLVSCRNLLIYFGADAQNEVLPVFHYALRPDGYLFLGTAENVGQFGELFAPVGTKQRIFRRRQDEIAPRLPRALSALRGGPGAAALSRRMPPAGLTLRQSVESHVLERFAPPFVLVNREGDIAHYSARTGKYLEAAPGAPTRQLLTAARKGLRLDLRTALREAVETGAVATREGVAVEGDEGRVQLVTVTVEPLRDDDRDEPFFLVLFTDEGPTVSREEALIRARTPDGTALHLERELRETRERLQSLIEEYETALEELKSANEELVSVNEELQSANEQLEASKEELQSVNERLHEVNAALIGKVEALDRANSDLQNLFDSTDVATVFLDPTLVIRSFTPTVARVFNILPGDRGRPITDLASRFSLPDLSRDIAAVLASGDPIERRVMQDGGEAHYLVRFSAYRDREHRTGGVVVSFVDITGLTRAEGQQDVLIAELHHRTRNLLTVVQAIASMTLGRGGTLRSFTDRLAALGRAQELLHKNGGEELDLLDVVNLELGAQCGSGNSRVVVEGPAVRLTAERVQTLALALHELTTNATKYGALKQDNGRVAVRWNLEPTGHNGPALLLDWQESGCEMPEEVPPAGYGRRLIEKALGHTLGAPGELTFTPDGVHCRIRVPLGQRPDRPPSVHPAG